MIQNKYKIEKLVGRGKFGSVYKGSYMKRGECVDVAIKTENSTADMKTIKHETKMLNYLQQHGCKYIPFIFWYGQYSEHTCLIMTYYEYSLADFFKNPGCNLYEIMATGVRILESIHTLFVLHRDIKPENFMIRDGKLFLIDFGLSTFYLDESGRHISDAEQETITGTLKYASIYLHGGHRPSRRDDLISLGYIGIMAVLDGTLPWSNIRCDVSDYESSHMENQVRKGKKELESLCFLKERDAKMYKYLEYCYRLGFSETPCYQGINQIFAAKPTPIISSSQS